MASQALIEFINEMGDRLKSGEEITLNDLAYEARSRAQHTCECGKGKQAHQRACGDCLMAEAAASYDPERHDPDSILFDDSYTGPSELELGGGCNRCGSPDDCYCNG